MDYTFQTTEWNNNETILRGSLYLTNDHQAPWIIMCHGFTSHRIGPSYLFVSLARSFATAGFNTLTFDFMGCGESDGVFANTTMGTLCSDCHSACRYITETFHPPKTLLLGHSFGGTVAVLSASTCHTDGMVLMAPLAAMKTHAREHTHILDKGVNTNGNYEFGPLELKHAFLQEMESCNPVAALSEKTTRALLVLHGENDIQIPLDESVQYVTRAQECKIPCAYYPVKQGDHRFSTVASRDFLKETIISWAKGVTA